MTPVLELDNITFGYGRQSVLEDVSLSVDRRDFVGLIGPNGSGKSTLLRIAVGLLRPDRGAVRLFGRPIDRFREWPRIGYVPQVSAARAGFPATVAEVVLAGRTARRGLFRRLGAADRRAADRALELVGLGAFRHRLIGALSGGQHQRVMLARALAGEPDLLLLDEPAAGVDVGAKFELLDLLSDLCRERGLAVVYISHDLEALRSHLTKIALLDRRLVYFGPRDQMPDGGDLAAALTGLAAVADHHEHGGEADR